MAIGKVVMFQAVSITFVVLAYDDGDSAVVCFAAFLMSRIQANIVCIFVFFFYFFPWASAKLMFIQQYFWYLYTFLLSSQTTTKRIFNDVCSDPAWKINLSEEHRCFRLPSPPPYEKSHVWLCSAYYELMCTTRTSETHGYQQALRHPCTWHSGIIGRDGPHSPFVGPQDCLLAIIPPTLFTHLSPSPLQCLISSPFTQSRAVSFVQW